MGNAFFMTAGAGAEGPLKRGRRGLSGDDAGERNLPCGRARVQPGRVEYGVAGGEHTTGTDRLGTCCLMAAKYMDLHL